jgi:hypothetical protein
MSALERGLGAQVKPTGAASRLIAAFAVLCLPYLALAGRLS